MKKQGYNARLDDHLGAAHGHKSQSMAARRHESEGEERSLGKRKFSGDKQMDKASSSKSGRSNFDSVFKQMEAHNRKAGGHTSCNRPMA